MSSGLANAFGVGSLGSVQMQAQAQECANERVTVGRNLALTDKLLSELSVLSTRLVDAIDGPEPPCEKMSGPPAPTTLINHTDQHNLDLNRAINNLRRAISGLGLKQ